MPAFSRFASSADVETAFSVLAVAKQLMAAGKDVIELEIGDSPFPTPPAAIEAGVKAIRDGHTRYGPSLGIVEFRQAAADYVNREYGLSATAGHIVAGPGAKNFEQLFCEAFLNPGDGVLVFSPHFPTYPPNIARRDARVVISRLQAAHDFRPSLDDVRRFLAEDRSPRAIFINSPHNPTGGVALQEDLEGMANLVRGRDVAVFSDEPYDRMVWRGRHHSLLEFPGMMQQTVAAYTFSKSFSMSGWRLGFAVSSPEIIEVLGKLTNSALSCVPPFTQMAGIAAMRDERGYRDQKMQEFRRKVELLVDGMNKIDGVSCLMPGGTFYVFPSVAAVCSRLGITSHGLAMYLLEGADPRRGVACLGGEAFGEAGRGFLRLSCAQPDDRIKEAFAFMADAFTRGERVNEYLRAHQEYRVGQLTEKQVPTSI
ncbi:MAG TPA: aminotransferase class I/II-fold pyridoxal phosphate-dependent enzyme [Vicinamibacterales bacterium]|jgi:aspartate aminotransferase|nr:aminotransferase class I/II-fold pyridoxal phosphate-dependent enzyme [Vicinamibacterales bacterium]